MNMPAPTRAAEAIRKLIVDRSLGPEAALPSDRELSRRLGFSYMTIRAANGLLVSQGIIRREQGRGTFVIHPPQQAQIVGSSRRQQVIGYVYVSQGESEDYALRQFRIMERLLKAKGHPMVLGVLHEEDFGRALPSSFDSQKLDALIIDGFLSRGYLHQLAQLGKPVVVAGNHSAHESLPCVEIDFRELSRLLTKALFDQGMETVCMICEPLRLDYGRELLEGYRQALLEIKRGVEIVSLWEEDDTVRMAESLRQILARFGPKVGFLGYHNELGLVMKNLAAAGVAVAECVAAVGADHRAAIPIPHVVYEVPVDRLAAEAAESLCRLLNGEAVGDKVIRPGLRAFSLNERVNFEWKVDELQRQAAGGGGRAELSPGNFAAQRGGETVASD